MIFDAKLYTNFLPEGVSIFLSLIPAGTLPGLMCGFILLMLFSAAFP
jgi:hypothetical protein